MITLDRFSDRIAFNGPAGADEEPPDSFGADPKVTAGEVHEPVRAAHHDLIRDAAARMVRRLAQHAQRAAGHPSEFLARLDALEDHRAVVLEALALPCRAASLLQGEECSPAALADSLLTCLRAALLDASGRATAKTLASEVERICGELEKQWPSDLADYILHRKLDDPGRKADDALAILDGIPERRPGQILPPFPVNVQVPYTMTAEKLRDCWSKDKVEAAKVHLRELIATQDWLIKDDLRRIIKEDENWSPESLGVEGSPTDHPYVVSCQGNLYIYDGHHRLSAKYLLAIAKTKVYLIRS